MPSFMPSDLHLWFSLVDLVFENYRITDDASRFRSVVGRLPPDVTLQVMDVTLSSRSYDALE